LPNEIKKSASELTSLLKNSPPLPYDNSQAFYIADGFKNEGMTENLIRNELIDGVSDDINELNDKLMELKWNQVNGDILTDGKKCDFLVLNDDDKFAYLIELKRKKFLEGMEQVKTSHQKIKSALPDYQFLFRIVHAGTNIHAVRSQEVVRWRESHGRTPEGKTIADLKKTPYIENI